MSEDISWRSPSFRQSVVNKINEAIQTSGVNSNKNSVDMENHVFSKARNKDEYLSFVARLIIHVREMSSKNKNPQNAVDGVGNSGNPGGIQGNTTQGQSGMPDPINALQNLATQGTRNIQPQMMGGGQQGAPMMPNQGNMTGGMASGNMIRPQGPGPQQMQQMQQQMPQQNPGNMNNQMQMNQNTMGMQGNQMQMGNQNVAGGVKSNMPPNAGQMSQQNQMQMNQMNSGMQVNQLQMGGVGQGNVPGNVMNAGVGGGVGQMQMNPGNQPQMNPGNQPQMNQPNMQNMNNQMGMNQNPMGPNIGGVPQMMAGGGMSTMNMGGNRPGVGTLGMNPGQMSSQMVNPMQGNQMNPGMNPGQLQQQQQQQQNPMMNTGPGGVGVGPGARASPLNVGGNQMNPNAMMNIPLMRNTGQAAGPFPSGPVVRSVTPNFMRQSPSPSVPSPAGMSLQNSMVPSPAMIPSPSPQMPSVGQNRMNVMAPSPSNINTPGQPQAIPSPLNPIDDQIYQKKYVHLTKYKEPLKRMISRVGESGINVEKIAKLKKLLEILSNPNTRISLETLLKCETALENQFGSFKEHPASINNPLYDAIVNNMQSPLANHTLQRTFKPSLEAWFGPDIKNLPPSKKRRRFSEDQAPPPSSGNDIPHLLQGEIARLDLKFKISLDPTAQIGTKAIKLICCLDDKFLPCVPPISVTIPEDYPSSSPHCNIVEQEYNDTPFLADVQKALQARVSKLPQKYSLSHLLDTWAMSVRQACNPKYIEVSPVGILMGM